MLDFSIFTTADAWIALLTLAAIEIVLGIDNIVFLTILSEKLPPEQQKRGRSIGLMLALGMRLGLLFSISWVMGLTAPLFTVLSQEISGRDLILGLGGLFLLAKSTHEIFAKLEVEEDSDVPVKAASFTSVMIQIMFLDIVFSLDSVITAVGMADHVLIMAIAMLIAVGVMLAFVNPISDFVTRHPSMKMLALSFLILIGVMLMAESMDQHVNKGYIYFAMAFSLGVELLNLKMRKRQKAVQLRSGPMAPAPTSK